MKLPSSAPVAVVIALVALLLSPAALSQSSGESAGGNQSTSLDAVALNLSERDADATEFACVRQTGTRLASKARREDRKACQPGRAFNRDDIDATGASSLADALQRLDPAVTIRRR